MFNKRGISEIVGYVLLISISFALAGMVFTWLRFYVTPGEELSCDEGVSISIRGYNYSCGVNPKTLNITLKNDGRFNIAGYIIRVSNKTGETKLGVYTLNQTGKPIQVGNVTSDYYNEIKDVVRLIDIEGTITFIEVQPYILEEDTKVYCNDVSKQTITCTN